MILIKVPYSPFTPFVSFYIGDDAWDPMVRKMVSHSNGWVPPTRNPDGAGYSNGDFIWLEKVPDTPERISYLVHEVRHLIAFIIEYRGIKDEEFEAYSMQYFVESVLIALQRRKAIDIFKSND